MFRNLGAAWLCEHRRIKTTPKLRPPQNKDDLSAEPFITYSLNINSGGGDKKH